MIHVLELMNESSMNAKQEILKKYSSDYFFRNFLYYALNPHLTYRLSEETLRNTNGFTPLRACQFSDIFDCCDFLSRLRGIDDATVRQVKTFLYGFCAEEERELFIQLLAKTIRLGVTAKSVNKAIPGLLPEWEVQQAYPIEKYPVKFDTEFWLTQKLNGVRATWYNGQFIARSGQQIMGLNHICNELRWLQGFVLDGEMTLLDKGELSDNEAFRTATGILNSDSEHKTEICFTVFDAVPQADFESPSPTVPYSVRRKILDQMQVSFSNAEYVKILPTLYHGSDISMIDTLLEQMVAEDKEGLMLNTDAPYKRSRHKGILKVKRFYTMDLPIEGAEEGTGRLSGTLGALALRYGDNLVYVGSGFTDEQRVEYWNHREELVGTLCEVKYKEISEDKDTGMESLQFPVFVRLREDKSEVSFG
ncbi:MAG: hypothetical protein IKY16_06950 [Bacteroidales bacterium]|nr:hypothetical protein [Bacteroidales bacterium]